MTSTGRMNALIVHEHGGPEVLRLEETERPAPERGHVVVRVEAAGVNFIDVYQRRGLYRTSLPFSPGNEAAGMVAELGDGAHDVVVGDRVAFVNVMGAFGEFAFVPSDRLVPIPDGMSASKAAASMLQGLTAHYLLNSTYSVGPNDTVLVHAAAGGVGLLLCQMCRERGARVIGTVSTQEKAALARDAGASDVILYTTKDFVQEVARLTHGAGADVVYDSVGRDTFDGSLRCLRRRGMMVLFGGSSGPVPPFDPQILNRQGSLYLTRPSLEHYVADRNELLARSADVLGAVHDGRLRVHIDAEYPLADAAIAFSRLESRQTMGKLLLIPSTAKPAAIAPFQHPQG